MIERFPKSLLESQGFNSTDDAAVFGEKQYVYCASHLAPHTTGWCTVPCSDKIPLGVKDDGSHDSRRLAAEKCRQFRLPLTGEKNPDGAIYPFFYGVDDEEV